MGNKLENSTRILFRRCQVKIFFLADDYAATYTTLKKQMAWRVFILREANGG